MTNPNAQQFGAYLREAATKAGYDLGPRGGGRAALAADVGMSPSAISRALRGETLPRPAQMEGLAKALGVQLPDMMREANLLSDTNDHEWPKAAVRSVPTPEGIADVLGITHPVVRENLVLDIEHAIRAQARVEGEDDHRARG